MVRLTLLLKGQVADAPGSGRPLWAWFGSAAAQTEYEVVATAVSAPVAEGASLLLVHTGAGRARCMLLFAAAGGFGTQAGLAPEINSYRYLQGSPPQRVGLQRPHNLTRSTLPTMTAIATRTVILP